MSGLQPDLLGRRAVDKRAVGGTEIFEQHASVAQRDFTMVRGDRAVIDDEIVVFAAPDSIYAGLELNFPSLRCSSIDQ